MPRGERGFTLVEVLITVVLLSIGVTTLLTGMVTAATASRNDRELADHRQVLLSSAERILASSYVRCADRAGGDPTNAVGSRQPYAVQRAAVTAANDSGTNVAAPVEVLRVDYWNGNIFDTPCSYDATSSAGLSRMQRITLKAGAESLVIVKREG